MKCYYCHQEIPDNELDIDIHMACRVEMIRKRKMILANMKKKLDWTYTQEYPFN